MYLAHFAMMLVLLGCSLGKSFVLQPQEKEPAAATPGYAVLHPDRECQISQNGCKRFKRTGCLWLRNLKCSQDCECLREKAGGYAPLQTSQSPSLCCGQRCHGESLNDIRKALLGALNLQQEPQVEADRLTAIREQWKTAFSAISHNTQDKAVTVPRGPAADKSSGLKCCQLASQIFLKDLGWENWVIYPESFNHVQCSPCNSQLDLSPSRCPSHTPTAQDTPSQMPCCKATSTERVPFLYMDEFSTLTISSVQLTRTCGPGNPQLPAED